MNREHYLKVVRTLTEQVVAMACPEKLADFDEDFADFAVTAGAPQVSEKAQYLRPQDQGLDTTLVAGMFFQVLLEASGLPAGSRERISFVRKKAKDFLVTRLAGQITLSQFYRLLSLIEEQVTYYFQAPESDWTGARSKPRGGTLCPLQPELVKGEDLRRALGQTALPLKGRRKLTPEGLWEFLRDTEGRWFRLLDFEARFRVNKKTAWSYLNLLLEAAVLEHNGEKANRVRYALAPVFRTDLSSGPGH